MHHYQGNPWDGVAPTSPESVSHQLMLDMNISFQILQDEIPSAHQRIKEAFNKYIIRGQYYYYVISVLAD